jgi:D-alanyl-D-alanine carboxypeptidase (penicillin-binding protein 5/6)
VLSAALLAVVSAGAQALTPPALSVRSATLIEERSGDQLYGFNQNAQEPIASTTKLMTALITLEQVKQLSAVFTAPNYHPASVDSQIGIVPGERITVHDLLIALMLPSADDAAEDLAYNVGQGSVARFIGMMNARARQLGLTHTHYSTPIGLDTPGNYSSASDLVKLATYLLQNHAWFRHIVALSSATLSTGPVHYVVNRNDLVAHYKWINGVKTGHTSGAGYVLVGSGTQGGMTLISAVLGTSSEAARDANTLTLLEWGFAHYHRVTAMRAGTVVARLPVKDRPGFRAAAVASQSVTRVLEKGVRIRTRLKLPDQLSGPLARHTVVGTMTVLAGRQVLARMPLLLARRLAAVSPLTIAARFITRPFTLLAILVLLGLTGALIVRRRGHDRIAGSAPSR